MNETFIYITLALFSYSVIQFLIIPDFVMSDFPRFVSTMISFMISLVLVFVGSILPVGDSFTRYAEATNTRVGDELIIQTELYPTQHIRDMRFIDKEVKLEVTSFTNVWGVVLETQYEVVISEDDN